MAYGHGISVNLVQLARAYTMFATDGEVTIDPDGSEPIFEVPIVLPLPEDLSFIP